MRLISNRLGIVCLFLIISLKANCQILNKTKFEQIKKSISFQGTEITTDSLLFTSYTFEKLDILIESVMVKPTKFGNKLPVIVLLPSFNKTAIDYLPRAIKWAKFGFACVTVSLPGTGRSNGKPDFIGSATLRSLRLLIDKLKKDPNIDSNKINLYGYSRGAMAASLLITSDIKVCSAVLVSGIYDFQSLFNHTGDQNMRYNILLEAGTLNRKNIRELSQRAASQRSSLLRMKKLSCNILILHGKKDSIVPFSQAETLMNSLDKFKKIYEYKFYDDKGHSLGKEHQIEALNFFTMKCK